MSFGDRNGRELFDTSLFLSLRMDCGSLSVLWVVICVLFLVCLVWTRTVSENEGMIEPAMRFCLEMQSPLHIRYPA